MLVAMARRQEVLVERSQEAECRRQERKQVVLVVGTPEAMVAHMRVVEYHR
jgi:hypothetical protein